MLLILDEMTLILGAGAVLLIIYLIGKSICRDNKDVSAKEYSKGILHRLINKL